MRHRPTRQQHSTESTSAGPRRHQHKHSALQHNDKPLGGISTKVEKSLTRKISPFFYNQTALFFSEEINVFFDPETLKVFQVFGIIMENKTFFVILLNIRHFRRNDNIMANHNPQRTLFLQRRSFFLQTAHPKRKWRQRNPIALEKLFMT